MRIAIDAMGGDLAPHEIVRGACLASRLISGAEIILVGDQDKIQRCLDECKPYGSVSIVHASQEVGMDESPVAALRSKPDSSIKKAVELVASGDCQAALGAGNTGAAVAACTLILRPLTGVAKPGICVTFPLEKGPCSVIDVGANINCRPKDLYQYAVMASIYSQHVLGIEKASIGLLSVGAEASKGNGLVRDTYELLKGSALNFIGNVEGRDIHTKRSDVVVCDGFTGNIVLKVSEGLAENLLDMLEAKFSREAFRQVPGLMRALKEMRALRDYSEYGGAPLLGINGAFIICHGRSGAKAIQNAVQMALRFAQNRVDQKIAESLAKVSA